MVCGDLRQESNAFRVVPDVLISGIIHVLRGIGNGLGHFALQTRRTGQGIDDAAIGQNKAGEVDASARAGNQTFVNTIKSLAGTVKQPDAGDDRLRGENAGRLWAGRDQKSE